MRTAHTVTPSSPIVVLSLLALLLVPIEDGRTQEILIDEGEAWRYLEGAEEPPFDWMELTHDDGFWLEGPSGFGYGTDTTFGTALDDDMPGNYTSLYIRKVFEVADPGSITLLQLGMVYDDGFVAYLNGVEIARAGLTGTPPPFDEFATSHETNTEVEWFSVPTEGLATLVAGENVLAIQGHNTNATSSDFALIPVLRSLGDLAVFCPSDPTCLLRTSGDVLVRWVNHPDLPAPYDSIIVWRDGAELGSPATLDRNYYIDAEPGPGLHRYEVFASFGGTVCEDPIVCSVEILPEEVFRRGDADDNGAVNISDAVYTLNALFRGGPQPACLDAADADDNGAFNITDAVYTLRSLFQGGPPPPAPGMEECGDDPTGDDLATCESAVCP